MMISTQRFIFHMNARHAPSLESAVQTSLFAIVYVSFEVVGSILEIDEVEQYFVIRKIIEMQFKN